MFVWPGFHALWLPVQYSPVPLKFLIIVLLTIESLEDFDCMGGNSNIKQRKLPVIGIGISLYPITAILSDMNFFLVSSLQWSFA